MNDRFAKSSGRKGHSPLIGSTKTGESPNNGEKTMFSKIKTAALSALIGLGTLAAIPAHADGIYLGFGNNNDTRVGVYSGDDYNSYRDHRHERDWRRSCSPERALDKAERMGLYRARIVDVNRSTVKVAGRQRGDRVVIVFANDRGCPVIFR